MNARLDAPKNTPKSLAVLMLRSLWIASLLFALVGQLLAGRGDKAGTAAASELLIPIGARSIALAGSSMATITGIEAMYWNPAGIARSTSAGDLFVSHMSYLADIGVEYIAGSLSLGDVGRVGLSVKTLSVGDIPVTTEDAPDGTGEMTSPTFLVAGGTFARAISDHIAVGIGANFVYEKMSGVSATTLAMTAGIQYSGLGGIDELSVGVAIKNIGPSLRYSGSGLLRQAQISDVNRNASLVALESTPADLPSTIEIGTGYTLIVTEKQHVDFSAIFQNNNYSDDEYRFGAEYSYEDVLFLRAGSGLSEGGSTYLFGPSFGVGVRTAFSGMTMKIDYAYRTVQYFQGNHVIGLILEF